MKIVLRLSIILLLTPAILSGQLSVKEKRQLERAYNAGIEQIMKEDYVAAIGSFNECLTIDPTYALAYLQRGRVQIDLGNTQEALSDLDLAIQNDRELGEAYFYKGYLLFGSDTSGIAKNYLELSMNKGFEIPESHYYLGLILLLDGDHDKALIQFDKAIRMKDDFALAYHERAGIKRTMGDFNGALYDYKASVNYQPEFPLAYNNMGSLKIIMGDYEGAIGDFDKAIAQDPSRSLAYNNRGYALYQLGELDSALVDFRSAIDRNAQFMEARLNMAAVEARKVRYDQAISQLDEVIAEYPEHGLLYLNRGLVKELKGDLIGACNDWSEALQRGEEAAEEYLDECK
jgi:tetratricopeptide (TPR) repeat protein